MIVYATRTGNVRYIAQAVNRLDSDIDCINLVHITEPLKEPFLLMTYTDLLGDAPAVVMDFLEENHAFCRGAIASGNTNFGKELFCRSIDIIEQRFGIPALHKIDLRGSQKDFEIIVNLHKERVHHE